MNLSERILLRVLLAAWLIPVNVGWSQRRTSPLWAWTRIVAAVWLFSVFELMVWFPGTPNLDWWIYAGIAIYIARFFIKRKPAPENSK